MKHFYLGWDVGGWNCDKNPSSRDAIIILDQAGTILGHSWRGNLTQVFNQANSTHDCLRLLFDLCQVELPNEPFHVMMAIDTPLGFSEALINLITQRTVAGDIGPSQQNPYLYRETERYLFQHGLSPLSPVKDMIGSQATKGIHFLGKFAPYAKQIGIWTDGEKLSVFEGYPSASKRSVWMNTFYTSYEDQLNDDKNDALWCALLAYCVEQHAKQILFPYNNVSVNEGWIFVPSDVIKQSTP